MKREISLGLGSLFSMFKSVIYRLIFVISIFRTQSGLFCEWQFHMVAMSLFSNSDAFQLHIFYKASYTSNRLSFINSSEKQFLTYKVVGIKSEWRTVIETEKNRMSHDRTTIHVNSRITVYICLWNKHSDHHFPAIVTYNLTKTTLKI